VDVSTATATWPLLVSSNDRGADAEPGGEVEVVVGGICICIGPGL